MKFYLSEVLFLKEPNNIMQDIMYNSLAAEPVKV